LAHSGVPAMAARIEWIYPETARQRLRFSKRPRGPNARRVRKDATGQLSLWKTPVKQNHR